jgi:hypothetical protein
MDFGFFQPIKFDMTWLICFGYIENFFKWLKLVLLLNYNCERFAYAYKNMVFNRFGILNKIFIDQNT